MKMLMSVDFPHEPFNSLVREGKAGAILKRILDEIKPENSYFTEHNGERSAVLVFDITDSSKIPSYAEPFFLVFNANCHFRIAMTPADLAASGLDQLGKKWL
ncbi:panthothenate synthetase [uncultured Photobacterium sp.]|uniref:panthothenate synthetase n=1 Tax=uncultured Photobacterium sp. TaxID=173973 RepID=UPI00261D75FB|nr:panthothenate synthetase [uncultured Photobacterium sp.]